MLFSSALRPVATAVIGLSLAFGSAPAMANPCVAGMQGCVLPVADLPPPPVETAAPVAAIVEPRGFNYLIPLLVGAAALVALLLLLDDDDDEEEEEPEPVSP